MVATLLILLNCRLFSVYQGDGKYQNDLSALVSFNPASGVLLLHKVSERFIQAVLVERDSLDGAFSASVTQAGRRVHSRKLESPSCSLFGSVVGKVWPVATGCKDRNG